MDSSEKQEIKEAKQVDDGPTSKEEYFMKRLVQMAEEIEFINKSIDEDRENEEG